VQFIFKHVAPSPKPVSHELLTFGDARVDFTSMEATRAGKSITLTAQEFKLLKYLAAAAGRIVSRDELLNEVWGYQNYPSTRTVDNHVLRLRRKLEPNPAAPPLSADHEGRGIQVFSWRFCRRFQCLNAWSHKIGALLAPPNPHASVTISGLSALPAIHPISGTQS
jgi:hypothetical protein